MVGIPVTEDNESVDPITMMLYQLHSQLNTREVTTLAAIANVPAATRYCIEDGLDLFSYLNDTDKIHRDYLAMLLESVRRPDLVDLVERFYKNEWRYSAYAFTMETIRNTGEIPVIPRSVFKTVEITEKHTYDVYLHYSEVDQGMADIMIKLLEDKGVKLLEGDFREIWTKEPFKCRYCVPILSKAYIQGELVEDLQLLLEQEINPVASLKTIIPVLAGVTVPYLREECPVLENVGQFGFVGGLGECVGRILDILHKGLKTSMNKWYKPAVTLQCTSRGQGGRTQKFDIRLAAADSYVIGRCDNSVLFRGDKGIKGLRESSTAGHCTISTITQESGVCPVIQSNGHPLTFVSVVSPIYLPHGVSTILLGREWISIAGKRNASQCMAKIKISYTAEDHIVLKVVSPSVREEVSFTSTVTIGSGEGSNLKIIVPGVDILRQHLKLARSQEGWVLKPVSGECEVFLQLPKEEGCGVVAVGNGAEILLGTHTTLQCVVHDDIPEDEGIGLSETCSRMS